MAYIYILGLCLLSACPSLSSPALTFTEENVNELTSRFASAFLDLQEAQHRSGLNDNFIYLDNGIIRLGIDQSRGGALGYLSLSDSQQNLLNHHDFGRLVQGSFYSGPNPFDTPDKRCDGSSWDPWPWNPIGGGDAFNHSAILLNVTQTSPTSAIIVSRPYQWACNDVPCECNFTQVISLANNAVEVQLILSNARSDSGSRGLFSMTQELPAVYIIGEYCHLFTVNSSTPWAVSPDEPVEVPATWPWSNYAPSQRWMAFANSSDAATAFSVGVWAPFFTNVGAGRFFSSPPQQCGGQASDDPTGYIAPWIPEILDWNIDYPYNFSLVVGTVSQVQAYALAKHAAGLDEPDAPTYVFGPEAGHGRAHFTFSGGLVDSGWPVPSDGLVIPLNTSGLLVGPHGSWMATDVPAVYINGSWLTAGPTTLMVAFTAWGDANPCPSCTVSAAVAPGQGFQVVEVDLTASPAYIGRISRLGLAPSVIVQAGYSAQIKSITSQPPSALIPPA